MEHQALIAPLAFTFLQLKDAWGRSRNRRFPTYAIGFATLSRRFPSRLLTEQHFLKTEHRWRF
jgi:hypothetical protein